MLLPLEGIIIDTNLCNIKDLLKPFAQSDWSLCIHSNREKQNAFILFFLRFLIEEIQDESSGRITFVYKAPFI